MIAYAKQIAKVATFQDTYVVGANSKTASLNKIFVRISHSPSYNLLFLDPFADAVGSANEDVQDGLVHIRIQQRNGRKTLTTVQGLSANYDLKKIVRTCKKVGDQFI